MKTALTSLVLLSLFLVACGGTGESDGRGDAAPGKAEKAAAIADAIASDPAQMESILEKHGMTAEEFEALLYEISEDEALSDAYEAARKVPTPQ